LPKNKWSKYALKDGKVKNSYIREYCNRKKIRKTGEASHSDSHEQSRKIQQEDESLRYLINHSSCNFEDVKLVYIEPVDYPKNIDPVILNESWVINLKEYYESDREEDPLETYQEGRQGISSANQGRCEAEEGHSKNKNREKKMKEKVTAKEKKYEAKESKAYEKKEDKREVKKQSKGKKPN